LALSQDDEKRLVAYAVLQLRLWRLYGENQTEEDLLQEAFLRVLAGKRNWFLAKEPFIKFMFGTIRSLVRDLRRTRRGPPAGKTISLEDFSDVAEGQLEQEAGGRLENLDTPEELLHAMQQFQALMKEFEDDSDGWCVLEYMRIDGLSAEEARAKLGLTPKEFDAIRKRIERRFTKIFFSH
jgi:DNA-directed RNA polymerase specialized sigma24 family protein